MTYHTYSTNGGLAVIRPGRTVCCVFRFRSTAIEDMLRFRDSSVCRTACSVPL